MTSALLIFSKNLISGEVKSRLAATVGNEVAMCVYKFLVQHTRTVTRNLAIEKVVFYSNYIETQDFWDDVIYKKQVQSPGALGQRMQHALRWAFNEGSEKVAIIGTDCLELNSDIIMRAYDYLANHDIVIGPARDGGYYLIAMKQLHRALFENISWSTGNVLHETLEACAMQQLAVHLLPELSDVDDEKDLRESGLHTRFVI